MTLTIINGYVIIRNYLSREVSMAEKITWKAFIVPLIILIVFVGVIIGVINWQRSKTEEEPSLTVNLPEEITETVQEEVTIDGKTDEGNKLWINNEPVEVGDDGNFSSVKELAPGENQFEIKAETKGGKSLSTSRMIKRTSDIEMTTTTMIAAETPVDTPEQIATAGPVATEPLATSGPEDYLIPVFGLLAFIYAVRYWGRSRKSIRDALKK